MAGEQKQSRLTLAQERAAREVLLAARRAAEELALILGADGATGWIDEARFGEIGYTAEEAIGAILERTEELQKQAGRAVHHALLLQQSTTGNG